MPFVVVNGKYAIEGAESPERYEQALLTVLQVFEREGLR